MKASHLSFTLRDLNRQPAKVFNAVRRLGAVKVRARSGETFLVSVDKPPGESEGEFPDFAVREARMRALGLISPLPSEDERINRIIAGEE